eukprot:g19327.t1
MTDNSHVVASNVRGCSSHEELGLGLCSNKGICDQGTCVCIEGWNDAVALVYPAPGVNCTENTCLLYVCYSLLLLAGAANLIFCLFELNHIRQEVKRPGARLNGGPNPLLAHIYAWGVFYGLASIALAVLHYVDPTYTQGGIREMALVAFSLATLSGYMQCLKIIRNVLAVLGIMSVWEQKGEREAAMSMLRNARTFLWPVVGLTYTSALPAIAQIFQPGRAWPWIWWNVNCTLLCWLYGGLFVFLGTAVRRLLEGVIKSFPLVSGDALQTVYFNFARMSRFAGPLAFILGSLDLISVFWEFARERSSYFICMALTLGNFILVGTLSMGFGRAGASTTGPRQVSAATGGGLHSKTGASADFVNNTIRHTSPDNGRLSASLRENCSQSVPTRKEEVSLRSATVESGMVDSSHTLKDLSPDLASPSRQGGMLDRDLKDFHLDLGMVDSPISPMAALITDQQGSCSDLRNASSRSNKLTEGEELGESLGKLSRLRDLEDGGTYVSIEHEDLVASAANISVLSEPEDLATFVSQHSTDARRVESGPSPTGPTVASRSISLRLATNKLFSHLSFARLAEALQGLSFAQAEHRLKGLCAAPLDNKLARDCPLMRGVLIDGPSPSQVVEFRLTPADFVSRVIGRNGTVDNVRVHELGCVLVCTDDWFVQPHPASARIPSFKSLVALHESKGVKFLELFREPGASSDSDRENDTGPPPAAQEQFCWAAQRLICKAWVVGRDTLVMIDALPQPDPLTGSLGAGPTKQQLELILLEIRAKNDYAVHLLEDEFANYDPSEKNKPEEFKEYEAEKREQVIDHELKKDEASRQRAGKRKEAPAQAQNSKKACPEPAGSTTAGVAIYKDSDPGLPVANTTLPQLHTDAVSLLQLVHEQPNQGGRAALIPADTNTRVLKLLLGTQPLEPSRPESLMPENFGFLLPLPQIEPACITDQAWCRLLIESDAVRTAALVGMVRAAQLMALERVNSLVRHLARSKEWRIVVPGTNPAQQYSLARFLRAMEKQAPEGLAEAKVQYADCWPDLVAPPPGRETRFAQYLRQGGFTPTQPTVPLHALASYLYRLWTPLRNDMHIVRAADDLQDLGEAAKWVRASRLNRPTCKLARLWRLLGIIQSTAEA